MNISSIMSLMYRILYKDYVEVTPKYTKTYKYGILVKRIKHKDKIRGKRATMEMVDWSDCNSHISNEEYDEILKPYLNENRVYNTMK